MFKMKLLIVTLTIALVFFSGMTSLTIIIQDTTTVKDLAQFSQPHQCRFWGIIANSLPEETVLNHLINALYSLKNLGAINDDGWGLAYYNNSEPVVLRGELPANIDSNFDLAAQELAASNSHIAVGHVRLATSGASNIPNPHPFVRCKGGKWWTFGHNGGLSKTTLKNLIGPEYLAENPPAVGDNWDDPDVIDSDLYMLYILKCIEENNWNATQGIAKAVADISEADSGAMNFFLSDGETMWGFRRGYTLYYYYNVTFPQYSVLASQPPTSIQDGWIALNDYNLVTLTMDNPPSVIDNVTAIPEFPTTLIIPLFLIGTLAVAVVCRRKISTVHKKSVFINDNCRVIFVGLLYSFRFLLMSFIRVGRSVIDVTR
jgi:hypothetical protein